MTKELILLLGGARSGKSTLAQQLARDRRRVLFVATAEPGDDEMRARIEAHVAERPAHWTTLEEPVALADRLPQVAAGHDTVVIDCLTLWVSNLLVRRNAAATAERDIVSAAEALLRCYEAGTATWIVVSNEVGFGLVPPTPLGRQYRDVLGTVNQRIARRADRVLLMIAGLPVDLRRLV